MNLPHFKQLSNRRTFSTAQYVLLAACLYATIPVALSLGADGLANTLPLELALILTVIAIPILFDRRSRLAVKNSFESASFVFTASIQGALFILSLYFFTRALGSASLPEILILAETWPIFMALLIAPLIGQRVKALAGFELAWGAVAVIGVLITINFPHDTNKLFSSTTLQPIVFALLSSLAMGTASALKARTVDILQKDHGTGPFKSYFILQLYFAPSLILLSPLFVSNIGSAFVLGPNLIIVAFIAIINVVASMLFSAATLKMKRASDTFIWFFMPVFSIIYFVLLFNEPILGHELIGLFFILSANILISMNSDKTIAFRFLILSLLTTGAFCYYIRPLEQTEGFFHALSVLTIFFVVILTGSVARLSDNKTTERELTLQLMSDAALLSPSDQDDVFTCIETTNLVQFKRRYRQLKRRFNRMNEFQLSLNLDRLAVAKNRTFRFGQFVSLGSCIFVSFVIGIMGRQADWLHDVFVIIYLSSMVFSFSLLLDHIPRNKNEFMRRVAHKKGPTYFVRLTHNKHTTESIIWSSILVILIIISFGAIFLFPEYWSLTVA